MTYFWTLLMKRVKGWSSAVGQNRAHWSYMPRPSSTVSCAAMTCSSFSTMASSNSGTAVRSPGWMKNRSGSSTAPSRDIRV